MSLEQQLRDTMDLGTADVALPAGAAGRALRSVRRRRRLQVGSAALAVAVGAAVAVAVVPTSHRDARVHESGPNASTPTSTTTPPRDATPGPRAHLTVAGGCPPDLSTDTGVSNTAPGLAASLIPAGNPVSVLVCRYRGGTTPIGAYSYLTIGRDTGATRSTDPAVAVRAAAAVRTSTLGGPQISGAHSCPADLGLNGVVVLRYADGADVDVFVHASGCTSVSNGVISGGPSSALLQVVAAGRA